MPLSEAEKLENKQRREAERLRIEDSWSAVVGTGVPGFARALFRVMGAEKTKELIESLSDLVKSSTEGARHAGSD